MCSPARGAAACYATAVCRAAGGPEGPITALKLGMFELEAVQGQSGATAEHGIRESTRGPRCPLPRCTPTSAAPHLDQGYGAGETPGTNVSSVLGTPPDPLGQAKRWARVQTAGARRGRQLLSHVTVPWKPTPPPPLILQPQRQHLRHHLPGKSATDTPRFLPPPSPSPPSLPLWHLCPRHCLPPLRSAHTEHHHLISSSLGASGSQGIIES